jgi:hypothetical protein
MGQTPEKRIYLEYRARRHGEFVHDYGIGALRLSLARKWKRSCQEIRAIIARKGEPKEET